MLLKLRTFLISNIGALRISLYYNSNFKQMIALRNCHVGTFLPEKESGKGARSAAWAVRQGRSPGRKLSPSRLGNNLITC
jgi:hypothetical protein